MSGLLNVEHSVRDQKWVIRAEEGAVEALLQSSALSPLGARLIAGRQIAHENIDRFLAPKIKDFLPDPSSLTDMDLAVSVIFEAIETGKKICVFADYDVDGGTSAAQLLRWARGLGQDWELYVPDRLLEGYGPSKKAFERLKSNGVELVITVDCGAAAKESLEHAVDIGLDVVVIDHHLMGAERPNAKAIVNPNRQDDVSELGHLAAAGVSFMTVIALNREAKRRDLETHINPLDLLGLACLGTICDVVPLKDLNRAIVKQGLKVLSRQKNPGVEALADIANLSPPFTTRDVGFGFGPRINAGGRIGVSHMGAELLSTDNAQLAYAHAAELDRVNTERRAIQERIQAEAMAEALRLDKDAPVLIIAMDGWHPGIIGIVAGRLKDRFKKPSIVIGLDEEGIGKGSGRSVKGVNLGDALSQAYQHGLLISGGGHEMAGGLTIKKGKIPDFIVFMNNYLKASVETARSNQYLKVDAIIHPNAVSLETLEIIESVGPYGAGNPIPIFVLSDVSVDYAERLKNGSHIRVNIKSREGHSLRAICFGADDAGLADILLSHEKRPLHIAGQISRNEWKGRISANFQILDIAYANSA